MGGNHSIFKIDSGYMTESSSYFITVVVAKHPRRAYFTQEVVISPGDPPVVEIRYVTGVTDNIDNSSPLDNQVYCVSRESTWETIA